LIGDLDQRWHRLELRHLVALESIAAAGTFREAARRLGYSQSAVSEQIATLEAIIGAPVLDRSRGNRAAQPTAVGRALLRHTGAIGAALGAAGSEIAAARSAVETLRIGIFPSAAVSLLPGLVRAMRDTDPDVAIIVQEANDPDVLVARVLAGALDVCFTCTATPSSSLAVLHLLDDPFVLVVAADDPRADLEAFDPRTLHGQPLIDYRSVPLDLLSTSRLPPGVQPRVVLRTDDDATVRALVAAGIGAAVLPTLSTQPPDPLLRTVRLQPPLEPRRVHLAWLAARERPPALDALIGAATRPAESRPG
jgi:molybdate transport repressor ModE-like protein